MSLKTRLDRRRVIAAGAAAGFGASGLLGCSTGGGQKASPDDLAFIDLADLAPGYRAGKFSPTDVTRACLDRIRRFDGGVNSFVFLDAEGALDAAQKAADEIAAGRWRGPLHGAPIAIKDNINVAGMPTTAASEALSDVPCTNDAPSSARLRGAGAIVLGKLNMHELALGTTSAISRYGPVRNPWSLDRVSGGSSGGSAAAVSAGFCFGALGTDTGGSIRIPAAACGVVGMKPTHGLVSLDGVILVSASHDHVGPICRTVSDTALMLQALTDDRSVASYNVASPPAVRALTVGILDDTDRYCDGAPLEPDVREAFQNAVALIATLVGAVRPAQISYPDLGPIIDIEAAPFHRTLDLSRLKPETRAGIEEEFLQQGGDLNSLLASLARFREEFANSFDGFDLVMAPTLPSLPTKILEAHDPFALAACTFAFSQAGAPAISVPCGFSREGLPIGLMIGGPPGTDAAVLALAAAYEAAGGWRGRRPNL